MVARSVGGVGSTGAWAISLHKDEVIAELAARYRPAIAADQADPQAGERWERWLRAPLPDAATRWRLWETDPRGEAYQSVVEFDLLTAAGRHVEDACYGDSKDDDDPDFRVAERVWGATTGPAGDVLRLPE